MIDKTWKVTPPDPHSLVRGMTKCVEHHLEEILSNPKCNPFSILPEKIEEASDTIACVNLSEGNMNEPDKNKTPQMTLRDIMNIGATTVSGLTDTTTDGT